MKAASLYVYIDECKVKQIPVYHRFNKYVKTPTLKTYGNNAKSKKGSDKYHSQLVWVLGPNLN